MAFEPKKVMVQTFEYGKGRYFIAGLFWQPLPGGTASARKHEVEKIAAEQKFDLMVVRTTGISQVGFTSLSEGAKPGMLSAAAMISKTVEVEGLDRNLLCATEIGNGKWLYVAQREGVILHNGDFIGTEDEVRSRMLTDLSLSDWETLFAPAHWGVQKSIDRPFKSFFPKKKGGRIAYRSWWALKPVKKSFRPYLPFIALACVGVFAAYGISQWMKQRAAKEAALNEQMAQASMQQAQPVKLEHPWKAQPRAMEFAKGCDKAFSQVRTLWPGNWDFVEAICEGNALTVSWLRQDHGWVSHLQAQIPNAVISKDGSAASQVIPFEVRVGEDEHAPQEKERLWSLYSESQKLRYYKISISSPQEPVALPGDKPTNPAAVKDWKELAFHVTGTMLPPITALQKMDGNGLRVKRISKSYINGVLSWKMEGIQYVQP